MPLKVFIPHKKAELLNCSIRLQQQYSKTYWRQKKRLISILLQKGKKDKTFPGRLPAHCVRLFLQWRNKLTIISAVMTRLAKIVYFLRNKGFVFHKIYSKKKRDNSISSQLSLHVQRLRKLKRFTIWNTVVLESELFQRIPPNFFITKYPEQKVLRHWGVATKNSKTLQQNKI